MRDVDTKRRPCQGEIPERPQMFDMRDRWQYKRCGYPVAFQNLDNPRITITAEHGCGKPSCPDCRPGWEHRWQSSTMKHWGFVSLADDDGREIRDENGEVQWVYALKTYRPVYLSTVSASDFESIRRQIKGHARQYLAISPDHSSGDVILFTDDKEFGARVRRDAAPGILKAAISMASGHSRCITSSRGWKLPPRKKEDPKWRRIRAVVRVTVDNLSRALMKWGKRFTGFGDRFRGVRLLCHADELERLVRWLEYGIPRKCLEESPSVT